MNRYAVCYIRVYCTCISDISKNCTGRILEGTGRFLEVLVALNYCRPVWAEP